MPDTPDNGRGTSIPAADENEILALLKRHVSFAAMGDGYLRRIIGESRVENADAGTMVFCQGDRGNFAYLVLEGEMSVEVDTPCGGRITVAVIRRGGSVGEVGAFADTPRTASVSALTDARLLRLEQRTIRTLMGDNPDVAMSLISELGRRLQRLNGTIATLTQATTALAQGEFEPEMLRSMKDQADRFSHFADVFENMAGEITRKRVRRQEMETAAEIQRSFLPTGLDSDGQDTAAVLNRFKIFASMLPAKDVGGDFFDYFMVGGHRLAFAIGDVSGKGVPAAMFMSVSRTVLKTIAREGWDAGACLTRMNKMLAHDNAEGMFVTLFYGCLDLDTGLLEYCSAGHNDAYVLSPDRPTRKLSALGPAVGLFEDLGYDTETVTLEPGESVYLYTDGITEAFDSARNMFGEDRLDQLLELHDWKDPEQIVAFVSDKVDAFAAGTPQADDITALALLYKGSAAQLPDTERRFIPDRRHVHDRRKADRRWGRERRQAGA